MKEIYEKFEDDQGEDDNSGGFKEVSKIQATHKHTCYHDEKDKYGQARPCKREKI